VGWSSQTIRERRHRGKDLVYDNSIGILQRGDAVWSIEVSGPLPEEQGGKSNQKREIDHGGEFPSLALGAGIKP